MADQNAHSMSPLSPPRLLRIFLLSLVVALATRLPVMPEHLYSFDSVNLALALDDFDPLRNQPQPPGYPFFVGEARLVYWLIGSPEQTFAILRILIGALSVALMYVLGRTMFSGGVGLVAAALLVVNPPFWYGGLTNSLRLHEALFSCLIAWLCWRALKGDAKYFLYASIALGVAGGFRPVVELRLLPLWLWVGWRLGGARLLLRNLAPLAAGTLAWISVLVIDAGGPERLFTAYSTYIFEQMHQTSALIAPAQGGWRRMVGRVILWTGVGALGWVWTLPGLWRSRANWTDWPDWPDWNDWLYFLALWFLPSLAFNLIVHTADPDHILSTVPPLCLVGAAGLAVAETRIPPGWYRRFSDGGFIPWAVFLLGFLLALLPEYLRPGLPALWAAFGVALYFLLPRAGAGGSEAGQRDCRGPLAFAALAVNILFFFNFYRLPAPPANAWMGRLRPVIDALHMGTYETSYARVRWVDQMTDEALGEIAKLKARGGRELVLVWTRDATPEWRKVSYYFPQDKLLVLEEKGDPTALATRARLWVGTRIEKQFTGGEVVQIPVARGARIVWLMAGGKERELTQALPLTKVKSIFYTDLPETPKSFRWGPFEFVSN